MGTWVWGRGIMDKKEAVSTHFYAWGNNPKRKTLKGRKCRIVATGRMLSCQVEFENGQQEIVSRRALRRLESLNVAVGEKETE